MSIKDSLIKWLMQYKGFEVSEIINNEIVDGNESYGISKEPTRIIENEFIDGSKVIIENYNFVGKRLISNNTLRKNNDTFFDDLEEWIENQPYPNLGKKKHCDKIQIVSSNHLLSASEKYGMYVFGIEITYRKEK